MGHLCGVLTLALQSLTRLTEAVSIRPSPSAPHLNLAATNPGLTAVNTSSTASPNHFSSGADQLRSNQKSPHISTVQTWALKPFLYPDFGANILMYPRGKHLERKLLQTGRMEEICHYGFYMCIHNLRGHSHLDLDSPFGSFLRPTPNLISSTSGLQTRGHIERALSRACPDGASLKLPEFLQLKGAFVELRSSSTPTREPDLL